MKTILGYLEKLAIFFENKERRVEKAQCTCGYMSILRRAATPSIGEKAIGDWSPFSRYPLVIVLSWAITICSALPLYAEDAWPFHGFIQGLASLRTATDGPTDKQFILLEERLQLEFSHNLPIEDLNLFIKSDFINDDAIEQEEDIDVREMYVDYSIGDMDIRLGRQIITWGVADRLFITDVFPKSWVSFYAGRPLQYLKIGSDAIKINYYPESLSLELIAIPLFAHDDFPTAERMFFFDPLPQTKKETAEPPETIENTQLGIRVKRYFGEYDITLYAYRGYMLRPGTGIILTPERLTYIFPKLSVYGMTLQRNLLSGVLSMETAYYDSREDRDGDNPLIDNSQLRYLAGFEREMASELTLGVQYYIEQMLDYTQYTGTLPPGFPRQDEFAHLATLNVKQQLLHQTLTLSLFSIYNFNDEEIFLQPEVKYKFTDALWLAVGANVFEGGKAYTRIGQFDKNDNIYTIMQYHF